MPNAKKAAFVGCFFAYTSNSEFNIPYYNMRELFYMRLSRKTG